MLEIRRHNKKVFSAFFYTCSLLCLIIHVILLKKLHSISSWMEKDTRIVLWMNGLNSVIIGAPAEFQQSGPHSQAAYEKSLKLYTGRVLEAVEGRKRKKK